ncbi:protein kinase domain-containing protein [Flavobacterium gelatinilyticum]|uniref:protein kinase domain-containing protein n=1 Tax=Flavobacterium gelatinilyticum TaxID=3003260 RepID=UPI002480576C|nr:protein kinase [Flavobacterium gelatinilyticum]
MKKESPIEFIRKKDYKFLEEIGQGGTGRTVLLQDELIDELFVCKKYQPFYKEHTKLFFKYFIDEIKILHTIYHKNIVRVFNHYLYPDRNTGYILMEYIKGEIITDFLRVNLDKIEDIFLQTIEGFRYLEENNILHRDIRPENILISDDGVVKIIDFGFSKNINFEEQTKSISLNWRYTTPNEFTKNIYDNKTEIYFVGKLFEEILLDSENVNFKFSALISKMILPHEERYSSFFDIYRDSIKSTLSENEFTLEERKNYQFFANNLIELFSQMPYGTKYNSNLDEILKKLEELYNNSILEDNIQNNNKLTKIFINGKFSYYPKKQFSVSNLSSIIQLFKSNSDNKRKIILNNLWERFDKIERYNHVDNDLPF